MRTILLALMATAALWGVDPVTIFPTTATRGTNVRVTVPNAPEVKVGTVRLASRTGWKQEVAASPVKAGTVEFAVPPKLPLGAYSVTARLDGRDFVAGDWLKVMPAPDWQVHLSKVDPETTYDTEPVWILDRTKTAKEAKPLNVAEVTVRGQATVPERILVNGKQAPVVAAPCANMPLAGTEQDPAPNRIYGEIVNGDLRLCQVPVPTSGRLEIAIGGTPAIPESARGETVWVPNYKPRQIRTARMKLQGSGFLQDRPEDNEIIVNGAHVRVRWDSCSQLPGGGAKNNPVENEVHGQVVSSDQIEVCRVPVPDDGEMMLVVRQGDLLSEPRSFKVFRYSQVPVATVSAIAAGALGLLVLVLMGFVDKHHLPEPGAGRLRILFLDAETNTYSLSKFQFYLWTAAALFGYSYLVISKMLVQRAAWPDIPGTLPGIIAIGAGTAIGSQVVTGVRGPKGSGAESPNLSDFVTSGGVAAADRIQMLVWTLFGVGAFCLAVVQQTPGAIQELSPVPQGMLYLMGLSSVGYLGGKLARKPGPVINEISITPSESEETVWGAGAGQVAAPPNLAQPVAQAQAVAQGLPAVASPIAKKAVDALTDALVAAKQAKTAAGVTALIASLANFRTQAESAASDAANQFSQSGAPPDAAGAAENAQKAAAALQDLAAGVTQAASVAAGGADVPKPAGVPRTIDLRGRNLSTEALLEINGDELPFRMLMPQDGKKMPQVVLREQDDQSMARLMRLSIDPAALEAPDLGQYTRWFGKNGALRLTLTNPDGQKADISFSIPPGAAPGAASAGVTGK